MEKVGNTNLLTLSSIAIQRFLDGNHCMHNVTKSDSYSYHQDAQCGKRSTQREVSLPILRMSHQVNWNRSSRNIAVN